MGSGAEVVQARGEGERVAGGLGVGGLALVPGLRRLWGLALIGGLEGVRGLALVCILRRLRCLVLAGALRDGGAVAHEGGAGLLILRWEYCKGKAGIVLAKTVKEP